MPGLGLGMEPEIKNAGRIIYYAQGEAFGAALVLAGLLLILGGSALLGRHVASGRIRLGLTCYVGFYLAAALLVLTPVRVDPPPTDASHAAKFYIEQGVMIAIPWAVAGLIAGTIAVTFRASRRPRRTSL